MKIIVFQHLSVEHPGALRGFWDEAGHEWVPVELDAGEPIPDLESYNLLVAMGGPQDLWQKDDLPWMRAELAAIRKWVVDMGRPYLGICLGHQLLTEALGGQVTPMARPEVGLAEVWQTAAGRADPLFAGLPEKMLTFQWHGAEASVLPDGAVILAANAACPTQAIRWGRHAYGLQYHVEITPVTVSDWQDVPAYAASLEAALGAERACGLADEVTPRLPEFLTAARTLNTNFAAILSGLKA
ncbi:MAG TPA: type 1 glutamine amidotransferase [Paenirhodobacter sp.]